MDEKSKILIVYDELTTRVNLQLILAKEDYDVQAVASAREALQILAKTPVAVIFTDLRIQRLLTKTKRISPETIVIVLGSHPPVESAVKAIPHDVYDYLVKPYEAEAVKRAARRAVEHKQLTARLQELSVLEKRLEASEEQYCTLIESASDLIFSMDAEGRLIFVNRAFQSAVAYRAEEVIGRHYSDFIVPEDRPKTAVAFARLMNGDETTCDVTVTLLNQAGERGALEIRAYPVWRDGQIVGITGLARDVTERHRALDREQQRARQLAAIREISRKVAATLDLDTVIEQVSTLIRQHFGYDVVLVFLMDPRKNQLVCKEGAIGYVGRPLSEHALKIGEGIIGWVAQTGETLLANDTSQEPRFHYADQLHETRAELAIPLKARGQVVGVLNIESARVNAFGPDNVMILESLADEVAVAIENARLYGEVRQKVNEMAMLQQVSEGINRTLVLDEVLQLIIDSAVAAVPAAETGSLFLVDENRDLVLRAGHGLKPSSHRPTRLKWGEGYCGWAAQKDQSLILDNVPEDPRAVRLGERDTSIKSAIVVPLQTKEKTIGTLCLDNRSTHGAFDEQSLQLLQAFAHQSITAIENARLMEETRHRAEQMTVLVELHRVVTEGIGFKETLDRILRSARKIIPVSECSVTLLDEPSGDLVVQASTNGEIGLRINPAKPSAVGWVVQTKQILAEEEVSANPIFDQQLVQRYRIKSALVVPVIYKDKAIGTLGFSECESRRAFSEGERMMAQAFAHQAAIAIEKARLYEERDRKVRELTALNKIATSITSTLDLERVLNLTMQEVQDVLGMEVCSLMLLDEQTHELVFKVSLGPGAEQAKQIRLDVNRGIAGWVAREGKPDLVLDVRTDPRWYPDIDSHTGFVTKSILAVPLKSKEKVIGVIEAINKVQGAFTTDDLQLLNSISMNVTTAIENARLFGKLSSAYQEMTQSRAQILESRNTLRALFDGISDSICIIDQDLQIKAINRTAAMILGEEPQNLIGRNSHVVLCQSNGSCADCPITETFRTGKPASSLGHRIQKQGATRELEISTYPLRNAAGVVDRVIYIAQDVTEKRKMETTLLQSARLSAVGELAASVTHEIGNPLTAVTGNAQMLLEALEPSDPRYKMAQLIERAGLRMEKVVRNLLNFSRQEQYQFAPIDLNASIEDALSLVAYQLERDNIRVTKEFQTNLPLINASASHLQTIWANLLLNARDAIPKGKTGRIQITTRLSKDRRSIEALFIDNGSGIAAEALPRVFDPFFTTKPQGRGTGLGLYISNVVIAHHRGTIQVQSQVGKGSTFVVTLPLVREAGPDDAELSAA